MDNRSQREFDAITIRHFFEHRSQFIYVSPKRYLIVFI